MGLASSFAAAPGAEEIRDEMRSMAADGTLGPLFEGWGFFPNLNLEAMDGISNTRRRERYLIGGVAALVLLLTCSLFLVVRLRRQRSQLKSAESAVRESEDRFRTLSNASLEGIMIHNGKEIIDVNQACARMFGYENPFELVGRNPIETLLSPDWRDIGVVEVNAVKKDGTPFPAETETREMKHLGRTVRLVAWRDLTERRQATAALRESEERYRALFERSLDCVFLTDFSGRFLDANQAALDLFGYGREEIRSISFESLLSPEHVTEASQAVEEILARGLDLQRREYRVRRKDASWVYLECHSSLILRGGSPDALQCIARDITERKRAEEETAKLQAQLNQANKMESIGRLAGGVAHDFNNLLTVILGYADMVLSRIDSPGPVPETQVKKALEQISRAAKRAATLTSQLLMFSRRNPSAPKTVRLNDIVVGVEGMLRPLLGEHIEVVLSPGEEAGSIHADPGLLEQVLVNLAVNARDAMPEGGQLFITTSRAIVTEELSAEAVPVPQGAYVSLWVTDTGTGMTPEVQARAFEPFFTTKDPGKGTGLGLATVYGIVKQSGGHITLHSTPGAGTAFRILFPQSPLWAQEKNLMATNILP
jgi:PAS domain S-box-containing protein